MTRQEKVEYLGKYKLLDMEIARRCEELGNWRMRSRRCQTQSQKEERLAARWKKRSQKKSSGCVSNENG